MDGIARPGKKGLAMKSPADANPDHDHGVRGRAISDAGPIDVPRELAPVHDRERFDLPPVVFRRVSEDRASIGCEQCRKRERGHGDLAGRLLGGQQCNSAALGPALPRPAR